MQLLRSGRGMLAFSWYRTGGHRIRVGPGSPQIWCASISCCPAGGRATNRDPNIRHTGSHCYADRGPARSGGISECPSRHTVDQHGTGLFVVQGAANARYYILTGRRSDRYW